MLAVIAASSSTSPAQWPGDPGSLMDVPASSTFQRHIHMLRGHGGYTGCHRQAAALTAPACRAHTRHKCRPVPGRDRRSLLQVRTSPSPGLQTHTHSCTPQALSWPLCLAGTPAQLPGPPNHPTGIPIADWSSLSFGSKHLQPSYTHRLGKIQTFAPNSQHPVHQLRQVHPPAPFYTQLAPFAPHSVHSSPVPPHPLPLHISHPFAQSPLPQQPGLSALHPQQLQIPSLPEVS